MALIKCKECGKPVSAKAEKCPHCGVVGKRKTSGCAMFVAVIAGIFLIGYIASFFTQSDSTSHRLSPPRQARPVQEAESRPEKVGEIEGVLYTIINDDSDPGIKRSVDVRLEGRVSEEALKTIAQKLKKQESEEYPRTFILYYLPDMKTDAGAWASSHFDAVGQPGLHVRILGTTKEEHDHLSERAAESSEHEIIGRWMDETPFSGGLISFAEEEDGIYMIKVFQDGSEGRYELVIEEVDGEIRYRRRESTTNDYMVINSEGNLDHGDDDGIWTTSKSID